MESGKKDTSLGYEAVKQEAELMRALKDARDEIDYDHKLREMNGRGWEMNDDHQYHQARGYTALHVAIEKNKVEDIKRLLAAGIYT